MIAKSAENTFPDVTLHYHALAFWWLLLIWYDSLKVNYTYNVSADKICVQNHSLCQIFKKKKEWYVKLHRPILFHFHSLQL